MIFDVEIIETGNGGDAIIIGRDVSTVSGWNNMPYLAMFGGNVEQSTGARNNGEQDFSWWGNSLFFPDEPELQFNSLTERKLMTTALTSSGRIQIEETIKKDLAFMSSFARVSVSTRIAGPDRLEITIKVKRPEQLQEQIYVYLWDGVSNSLTALDQADLADFNSDFNNDFNS